MQEGNKHAGLWCSCVIREEELSLGVVKKLKILVDIPSTRSVSLDTCFKGTMVLNVELQSEKSILICVHFLQMG